MRDITKRKEMLRELERGHNRFRALFGASPVAYVVADRETGRCVEANVAALRLFRVAKSELIGSTLAERSSGEAPYTPLELKRRQARLQAFDVSEFEWQCRTRKGALIWIDVTLQLFEFGDATHLLIAMRDITARKFAEVEAERSHNRFRTVFDSVADPILICDSQNGRFIEVNDAASRVFGYAREQLLQLDIAALSYGVEPSAVEAALVQSRQSPEGEACLVEWQNRKRDGSVFWSELSLKYVHFGEGYATFALLRDISHRKETERQLVALREKADEANRAKSEFLATMSHEIRTPMNGVLGMNALLLESELSPDQRQMAETVRDSAEALLSLLDGVLDLAKLEAGKFDLQEGDFDVGRLVDGAVDLFGPQALRKGIALSSELEVGARGDFIGAPSGLRQVLLNLVANAVKFTPAGAVTVAVRALASRGSRARLRFEVRDTGIGVDAEAKARLFAPFEQADPSISRRFGGAGLGLSICRKLVALMGGEIGVDDREGGGAVFWFEVDLARFDVSGEAPGDALVQTGKTTGRILIVEDDAVNIDVATLTLKAAGYEIAIARDGMQAVAAAKASDFDLILMDLRMPVMDGISATRIIRALPGPRAQTPILALTADAMADRRELCEEVGMNGFIAKPLAPRKLREAVTAWMAGGQRVAAVETPAPPCEPLIDDEIIGELLGVMEPDDLGALVEMFTAGEEARAPTFAEWFAQEAFGEIADEAHRLISAAGSLGATRAQKLAFRLERTCRDGQTELAPALAESLIEALAESGAELWRRVEEKRMSAVA